MTTDPKVIAAVEGEGGRVNECPDCGSANINDYGCMDCGNLPYDIRDNYYLPTIKKGRGMMENVDELLCPGCAELKDQIAALQAKIEQDELDCAACLTGQAELLRKALEVANKFAARHDYWNCMGALAVLIPALEKALEEMK